MVFRWDEPACETSHGKINGYEYFFRIKDGRHNPKTGATEKKQVRFSMAIGKRFVFRVAARTVKGAGPRKFLLGTFGEG